MTKATNKRLLLASLSALFLMVGASGGNDQVAGGDPPARADKYGSSLPKDALVEIEVIAKESA